MSIEKQGLKGGLWIVRAIAVLLPGLFYVAANEDPEGDYMFLAVIGLLFGAALVAMLILMLFKTVSAPARIGWAVFTALLFTLGCGVLLVVDYQQLLQDHAWIRLLLALPLGYALEVYVRHQHALDVAEAATMK